LHTPPSRDLQLRAWRVRIPVAMVATDAKPGAGA